MPSNIFSLAPIVASTLALETDPEIGPNRIWIPKNEMQTKYVGEIFGKTKVDLGRFSADEYKSIASREVRVVNEFLKREGFDIQLEDVPGDCVFAAALLRLLVKWAQPGRETSIYDGEAIFPGVHLEGGLSVLDVPSLDSYLLRVDTENGDVVSMMVAPRELSGFDLLDAVAEVERANKEETMYSEAIFPMVDLNIETPLGWLIDLSTTATSGRNCRVVEALFQGKLAQNEFGAKVEVAAAQSAILESCSPAFKINKPFYWWITRPEVQIPIAVAYVDTDTWRMPMSID